MFDMHPETEKGNRCITAISLASEYPVTVTVRDVSFVSVTDGLLHIFSTVGYSKEIQGDNGMSFRVTGQPNSS